MCNCSFRTTLQASIFVNNDTSTSDVTQGGMSRGVQYVVDTLEIENDFFISVDFDGLFLFDYLLEGVSLSTTLSS
jgi:hypothetical protein